MNIQDLYRIYLENPVISIDSREPGNGAIFFSLQGERFNGNEFAESAIKNRCSFAVVDDESFARDDRYIVVNDALSILQQLAKFHRDQFSFPVVGITGTNGKTTTKELVSRVLGEKYNVLSTRGNLNNQIGVPLTLLSFTEKTEIAVVEMGANHRGEIAELCQIAKPTHGLITNIGVAHLEGFGSKENISKAKAELYDYLEESGGVIFYDEESEILNKMAGSRKIEIVPYSNREISLADFKQAENPYFLNVNLTFHGEEYTLQTKLAGSYNLGNVKAAIRVGDYFRVEIEQIMGAIESYLPENNRSQIIRTKQNLILLDAYNANPTSMNLAIDNFISEHGREGLFILGDMLELGEAAEDEHEILISRLKERGIQDIILVGEIFRKVASEEKYIIFETVKELVEWLSQNPVNARNVFIKGSRKIALEEAVDSL